MKSILNKLINQEILSKEEAKSILVNISESKYNPSQIASFLTVYMMRSISVDELSGFRAALLDLCIPVDLTQHNAIDLCGTGGDGKNTFNISTLASFVTAGAGIKVAKHGNYGVSSISGSSNVLEHLKIRFSNEQHFIDACLDDAGICILHAPLFHPAMKIVAPIRKELGMKTFFNMLGPLVNPGKPNNQLVGVYSLELARLYNYLYQDSEMQYTIVHSLEGYDEITLTGAAKVSTHLSEQMLLPSDFGVKQVTPEEIVGGATIEQAAALFMEIVNGKGTEAQNHVVCANAALAIATVENLSLLESFAKAKEALLSGKALQVFKKLQHLSNL